MNSELSEHGYHTISGELTLIISVIINSFVVGFAFGELLDVHELWIGILPYTIPWRIVYFAVSYVLLCIGIALANRCGLPITPTDLFPRELSEIISVSYSKIKITFDVTCLIVTAVLTGYCLRHIEGLGIGTVLAAFTMGKGIGIIGSLIDKKFRFKARISAILPVNAND